MSWIPDAVAARVKQQETLSDPVYWVLCEESVRRQCEELHAAFPKTALHAFAVKANPLLPVLELLNSCGLGCEAASIGEFLQARKAMPGNKIVLDSPCKTLEELKIALYNEGGYINVDNFQELQRVADLHAEKPVTANVGLRLNAQLGGGAIGALSTGKNHSKFGIGLQDSRPELVAAFKQHDFLNMVHVHSGSQGLNFSEMTGGVRAVVDFVLKDVEGGAKKVPFIDVGGGLSVNFDSDEIKPTFGDYATALKKDVPELFVDDSPFRMLTEFGRAVVMKAGIYLSRIEYAKITGGRHILLQHVGADLLQRTIWRPETFPLRVEIFDKKDGSAKQKTNIDDECCVVETDVAGPCCLGGDLACSGRMLPKAEQGDFVVIKDVGGYYYSSYSYYNMRQTPAACFFSEKTKQLKVVRRADTVKETMEFFDKPPQ